MKCKACGFDQGKAVSDQEFAHKALANAPKLLKSLKEVAELKFVELAIAERAPFFAGTIEGRGGDCQAVIRGTPTTLYACPRCGTVRIDIVK